MSENVFRSARHLERTQQNKRYFEKVIKAYAEFREFQPVVAIDYDPLARSKKLHPAIIHFLADVDMATKRVLKKRELFRQWELLVAGEEIKPSIAAEIISKCGRIYKNRGLAPLDYWRSFNADSAAAAGAAA